MTSTPDATSEKKIDPPAAEKKSDAGVRTAIIAGWFGIAGTVLTCIITWGLNQLEKKTAAPPPPANIAASAPQEAAANTLTSPGSMPVTTPPTTSAADGSTSHGQPKHMANIVAVSAIVEAQKALAAKRANLDEQLKQSPISFADWQAAVRDRFSVEQRRELFGSEVGKRVTWQGVFEQYNTIAYGPVTRENTYILVMYENEVARNATPLKPAPALCHFPALAKRQLSELRPGQRIVISGTLSNPDLAGQLLGTELQGCELLGVLDGHE